MTRRLPLTALLTIVLAALPLPLLSCAPADGPAPPRAGATAAGILGDWDRRRAAAWSHGSVAELRALYVPGSRTAAADCRMLRRWQARGLVVEGLTTQLLAVEVLGSSPGQLRLRVTDRVARVAAAALGTRLALPQDRPSSYVVVMARYAGEWLVKETTAA